MMKMPDVLSPARRVWDFDDLSRPGDYYLTTVISPDGDRPEIFFLLPIHHGRTMHERPDEGSGLHGITSPPWTFRECDDGSLEIRASIAFGREDPGGEYWHGFLDEGNTWRQV